MLVRLKPFDPRRGCVLRRFTYKGIKFQHERGWYRVDEDIAEYLRGVRQVHDDDRAPLAFDVCTEEEAKALDAKQEAEVTLRKQATDAVDVTTKDDPAEGKKPRRRAAKA